MIFNCYDFFKLVTNGYKKDFNKTHKYGPLNLDMATSFMFAFE